MTLKLYIKKINKNLPLVLNYIKRTIKSNTRIKNSLT